MNKPIPRGRMLETETGDEKLEERRKSPEEQNSYLSQKLDWTPEEITLMLKIYPSQ